MKMTRTVPALAGFLILVGLVGCKKETVENIIVQANKVDTTGLVVKLLFTGNLLDSTVSITHLKYLIAPQQQIGLAYKTMLIISMVITAICK